MGKKHTYAAAFVIVFLCGILTGRMIPGTVYAQETREETETENAAAGEYTGETEDHGETGNTGQEKEYVIRFHEDFDETSDVVFEQTVPFGETVNLMNNPWTHEGYVFAGWYAAGYGVNHALANAYADGAPVRDLTDEDGGAVDLYAGWYRQKE